MPCLVLAAIASFRSRFLICVSKQGQIVSIQKHVGRFTSVHTCTHVHGREET